MSVATRAAPRSDLRSDVVAVAALGCGLLAARPALIQATRSPTAVLAALFAALLVVGVRLPLPRGRVAPAHV